MPRKIMPLLVVVALGVAWALCVPRGDPVVAQPPSGTASQKLPKLLAAKPTEISEERDELRKLTRARYNAALDEVRARYQQFQHGNGKLDPMLDSFRRLLASGVVAADSVKGQVEFLEQYVELTRQVSGIVHGQEKSGHMSMAEAAQARYMLLDAQIQLLHAQRRLAGPAGVKRP
jgi:hypothetical protein